jgi:uncharacterized protein with ATP-grasp and redox domains
MVGTNWSQICLCMLKHVKLTSNQFYHNNTLKSLYNAVQIMIQKYNEDRMKIKASFDTKIHRRVNK